MISLLSLISVSGVSPDRFLSLSDEVDELAKISVSMLSSPEYSAHAWCRSTGRITP